MLIGYLNAQKDFILSQNNNYFSKAVENINRVDFSSATDGTYNLKEKDFFYHLVTYKTKEKIDQTSAEVHKRYIDFIYILSGKETMGYMPNKDSYFFSSNYDFVKDVELIKDIVSENFFTVKEGMFVIFYPGEIHRSGLMVDEPLIIRKLIFKILFR
ncbi:MAG: YhcH/YjgK/YiaL family protein [Actinobacteria bacterium]|nr:YhcH/YjgK/YiaL family protein [Actinomycetota bacterium]